MRDDRERRAERQEKKRRERERTMVAAIMESKLRTKLKERRRKTDEFLK
jgi:hypothetical protein